MARRRDAGVVVGRVTAPQRGDGELQCGARPLQTLMPKHSPSRTLAGSLRCDCRDGLLGCIGQVGAA